MKRAISVTCSVLATTFLACAGGHADAEKEDIGTTASKISFEDFERTALREPETGVYIVDGDTAIENVKKLREFWETLGRPGALIVDQVAGNDDKWSDAQKLNLTYCVSNKFDNHKSAVVQAMRDATAAWAAAANVKYQYVPSEDASCSGSNNNVVFDVSPVNANGTYLARSFFPDTARAQRNVFIDPSSYTIAAPGNLTGILRHELGHTLGFRHEHTRPEAGKCFEDNNWRPLTPYDSSSVMHYPQCNGTNTFALVMTQRDKDGAAMLYGAPGGGPGPQPEPQPQPTPQPGTATTTTLNGTVAKDESDDYGPFNASGGTEFVVTMTGQGDADLYVRFGATPTARDFNCRPYSATSDEKCQVTVPSSGAQVYVSVRGYAASSSYSAKIAYTKH